MTTEPEIPSEALHAAVEAAAKAWYTTYQHDPATDPDGRYPLRQAILAAAPHLIAEGRRQAAEAIRGAEPLRISVKRGTWASTDEVVEWAAWVAGGSSPAERAERQLRESRQRQAGLDYERIEHARAPRIAEGKVDR